jgi:nitrogen fixation/metabolism regulation signal transduction histidine kinase
VNGRGRTPRRRLRYETRVTLLSLAAGVPGVAVSLLLVWLSPHPARVRLTVAVVVLLAWVVGVAALRERVVRPLQTLSNLLAALREGDYSIRARGADTTSPLGLAYHEVNALADLLRRQRLDAKEATTLLRRVMEEIQVAVFAFDDQGRLRLLNHRAEALIDLPAERALGSEAGALGLAPALEGDTPRLVELDLAGGADPGAGTPSTGEGPDCGTGSRAGRWPGRWPGRWEVRRGTYRWEGRPHQLVVLSDLTRSLREEERLAWQRLVRVLSHEINNSLAPIQSIAASLKTRLERGGDGRAAGREMAEGLSVIEARAESLGRFIQSYARLARLPRPQPRLLDVGAWARRSASLETRLPVTVDAGPEATLEADGDQMEALLANLVRNAADAALETGGGARVRWSVQDGWLSLEVEDDGPGLPDTSNLFVPFFTTKPGGTGIGLTLCRQIAEAHGGTVTLGERSGARGCVARVRVPLEGPRS